MLTPPFGRVAPWHSTQYFVKVSCAAAAEAGEAAEAATETEAVEEPAGDSEEGEEDEERAAGSAVELAELDPIVRRPCDCAEIAETSASSSKTHEPSGFMTTPP
jgi:hypothetical protein